MDGNEAGEPSNENTCPFSEGCKRHYSPGDIMRYSIVIALSMFLFLLVISLFFPNIVHHPDLDVLNRLVDIFHHAISGAPVHPSQL